jgi:hypothetical protein
MALADVQFFLGRAGRRKSNQNGDDSSKHPTALKSKAS